MSIKLLIKYILLTDEQTNKTTHSRDQMQLPLTKENSNEDVGRNNAQPESKSAFGLRRFIFYQIFF